MKEKSHPVVYLYSSRMKWARLSLIFLAVGLAFIGFAVAGANQVPAAGVWMTSIFMSLGAVFSFSSIVSFIVAVVLRRVSLRLDSEGIRIRGIAGQERIKWEDVDHFSVGEHATSERLVYVHLKKNGHKAKLIHPIHDKYDLHTRESLVKLLNHWRVRYQKKAS